MIYLFHLLLYTVLPILQQEILSGQEGILLDTIFYTVRAINGDYADLAADDGGEHSITMFLLPEGTTVGSRLKLENFQWELV